MSFISQCLLLETALSSGMGFKCRPGFTLSARPFGKFLRVIDFRDQIGSRSLGLHTFRFLEWQEVSSLSPENLGTLSPLCWGRWQASCLDTGSAARQRGKNKEQKTV